MQATRTGNMVLRIPRTAAAKIQKLSGDDYQFVHKSYLPTYHFQKSLRRLPIPSVSDTCRRFLAASEAVLQKDELQSLKELVKDFAVHDAPSLQRELLLHDKRNLQTSFISEPWFNMYLRDRIPCPINYNPFMVYAPDPEQAYNDQLTRTTNLVISYGRIKRALDANCLEPEMYYLKAKYAKSASLKWVCKTLPEKLRWYGAAMFGAFPLDMSQYKSLFGGSRIPQKEKDWLFRCSDSKHFIVLRGGRIYAVNLFDENGSILPAEQIHACLSVILADQSNLNSDECVASLTSLERDSWAEIRFELSTIGDNSASLEMIDKALFAVCLDKTESDIIRRIFQGLLIDDDQAHAELSKVSSNSLIGDNASNRWFDKCFQLIIDAQGLATINFEHSWGDGVAVLRLMEESFRDSIHNHFVHPGKNCSDANLGNDLRRIEFTLNDSLRQKIRAAQEKHVAVGSRLHFGFAEYFQMNREFIKRSKLSPDSIMQLAIQLAFYKLFKEFVPTYESCSTAAFLKGRTECVRSATCATTNAVLAIQNNSSNLGELLKICSNMHSQLVKEAAIGQGFDRHLMGLRITAERLGWPEPKLFSNKIYQYMNRFILSTSTLSTETILFGGFGPVIQNGYGIAYKIIPNMMGAVITSYKDQRDALLFAEAIVESLDILKNIIDKQLIMY